MRKRWAAGLLALLMTMGAAALRQGARPAPAPSELIPSGALLVLEARDFGSLLEAWNNSVEKKRWLASDNFRVFARSRLSLRLQKAHEEFAAAAGFSPQLATVERVAGRESALALYDIGRLEFLYVTRLPMARVTDSPLWQRRSEFEPRQASGVPYYIHMEAEAKRLVAFAATNDYLLLATREDLLVGALALLAGGNNSPVTADSWYQRSVGTAGAAGDLRLVLDLKSVTAAPHFRSYWVQRNLAELRGFEAAVSDLHIAEGEIREERKLVRPVQPQAAGNGPRQAALAEALRFVPKEFGFYRAQLSPTAEETIALFQSKILAPKPASGVPSRTMAPQAWLSDGTVGSTADLEKRIDQEPRRVETESTALEPLKSLITAAGVRAVLQVESSHTMPGEVFVEQHSALVLLAESDWADEPVREALLAAVAPSWTTGGLGAGWVEKGDGGHSYFELGGLGSLYVGTRGTTLVVANRKEPLLAVLNKPSSPDLPSAADAAVYAAAFDHGREWAPFLQMMGLLDHPWIESYGDEAAQGREPRFFSENVGSLSDTLERVQQVSVVIHDHGDTVAQTVVYRLTP